MFTIPESIRKAWVNDGKRFHLELLKVADFRKHFDEVAKIGEHAEDIYIEPRQLSCLHTDDMNHRTVFLKFDASFFEVYQVHGSFQIKVLLSDWVGKLNKCNLDQHIRRLIVEDTAEGYIHLYGLNQNGILCSEFLPPVSSCTTLQQSVPLIPTTVQYDHVIEIPSKLFQIELNAHCKMGAQWLTFLLNVMSKPAYLTLSSMLKQGLGGKSEPSFLLPPENIIRPPPRQEQHEKDVQKDIQQQSTPLKNADVTVNLQYLKLLSQAYKQCLVVRLYLAQHAPLVLEFLSMQSRHNRSQDSFLQIWIAPRLETSVHPSLL